MKTNEKGITLTSLVIYVTVMSVVIAVISTITTYTYKNMNNLEEQSQYAVELNKFDMYFLKDIKRAETVIVSNDEEITDIITIIYKNEDNEECTVTYKKNDNFITRAFVNNSKNININVNVCKSVEMCTFSKYGKIIRVILKITNTEPKNMEYVAENLS